MQISPVEISWKFERNFFLKAPGNHNRIYNNNIKICKHLNGIMFPVAKCRNK